VGMDPRSRTAPLRTMATIRAKSSHIDHCALA